VAPAAAQNAVVTSERASAMKAEYPLVRFGQLAGFDVPALGDSLLDVSPHAASPSSSNDLVLPPEVHALDGRQVSVRGFMLPVDVAGDRLTRFILTASIDSCHFGMIGQPTSGSSSPWHRADACRFLAFCRLRCSDVFRAA
jgi:hypothetical protein